MGVRIYGVVNPKTGKTTSADQCSYCYKYFFDKNSYEEHCKIHYHFCCNYHLFNLGSCEEIYKFLIKERAEKISNEYERENKNLDFICPSYRECYQILPKIKQNFFIKIKNVLLNWYSKIFNKS